MKKPFVTAFKFDAKPGEIATAQVRTGEGKFSSYGYIFPGIRSIESLFETYEKEIGAKIVAVWRVKELKTKAA